MAAVTISSGSDCVVRMGDVKCKVQKKYRDNEFYCTCCCSGLNNKSSVQSHRNSRKHKENEEAAWIVSVLQNLSTTCVSAERLHGITELVEGVYLEHAAAAVGQLEVRKEIVTELQEIVGAVMPEVVLKLFGSSQTQFALTTSDVNIFLDFPDSSGTRCEILRAFLALVRSKSEIYDSVEEDFFAFNKIPRILLRHKKSGLLCDVRIMDSQPASIAALLCKYASIDERVVKLGTVFRQWAKLCQVDRQEAGHYPAHMFVVMVVHFLQQRQPPVLPVLHEMVELSPKRQDREEVLLFEDTYLSDLSHLKWTCENKESLGALWYGLLRYYGVEFKIDEYAVSILQLAPLHKAKREWLTRRLAVSLHRLVVEDPCNKKSNLARASSLDKEYHPTVNDIEEKLAPSIVDERCTTVTVSGAADVEYVGTKEDADRYSNINSDMSKCCDANESVAEHGDSSGPDHHHYMDEHGGTLQEQEMNDEQGEEVDRRDVDERANTCEGIVRSELLDSDKYAVAINVEEQDEETCIGSQVAAREKMNEENGYMSDRIVVSDEESHFNHGAVDTWPDFSPVALDEIVAECEHVSNEQMCTNAFVPIDDVTDELSVVTLDSAGIEGGAQNMILSVGTVADCAKPCNFEGVVSGTISEPIATLHPISYQFVAKNFAFQQYPIGCLTCKKLNHTVKECPEEILPQCSSNHALPSKRILDSLKQSFKSYMQTCEIDDEDCKRRKQVCDCILHDIRCLYPGAQLELFGSSKNGFGVKSSDLDLCLKYNGCSEMKATQEVLKNIATLFRKHPDKYRKVIAITNTRVPIIKFYLCPWRANCDISSENLLAMRNTKLLKTYADLDRRVRVLGYALKHFAKVCGMADASLGGLSSYAYILMLLHYLQRTEPPVIPVLQQLESAEQYNSKAHVLDGWNCYFFEINDCQERSHLWPGFGKNVDGIGVLWLGLLRYFCEFDWQRDVVTIRQSERLTKFDKWWLSKPMCIEDPFDLNHNLGQPVSSQMRQYILKRFQDALSYHSSAMDIWQNIDHVMDVKALGCDSRPPVRMICGTCNQLGHKDVDCPKGTEPRPIVNKIDSRRGGIQVASQQRNRKPKSEGVVEKTRSSKYYYRRDQARDAQDMSAAPQPRLRRRQRAAVTQDFGTVSHSTNPGRTTSESVAHTKSIPFTAQLD